MKAKRFYGAGLPRVQLEKLNGKLIVLEGADGSGRSTQIVKLTAWLENRGYAVTSIGLKRSNLVSEDLDKAKQGNILGKSTMSLFYATDFADQLENNVIPALRAGFIVLADRYIYTLMARDIVRGANREWVESLYSMALVPDAVFYLQVSPQLLVERNFQKNSTLDYWESGMDIGMSTNMFDSFIRYQKRIHAQFKRMEKQFGFQIVDGNRSVWTVHTELQKRVASLLGMKKTDVKPAPGMAPITQEPGHGVLPAAL